MIIYKVKGDECLADVAQKFNLSIDKIASDNGIVAPLSLTEGQCLVITNEENEIKEKIKVMSSIRPTVKTNIASKIMPHLTYVSLRSGALRRDGSLYLENDCEIKSLAKEYRVLPILEVCPSFSFNARRCDEFYCVDMTSRIAHNIKQAVLSNGYRGVNMNVGRIYDGEFEIYVELLSTLKAMLEAWDVKVFATVSEKSILSDDMELLGDAVDSIAAFPKTEGEDLMDVLEIEDILKLLCEVTEPSKIALCVPMSAKDCRMATGVLSEKCYKFSTAQAVRLSMERHSTIVYDESSCLSQFDYFDMEFGRLVRHSVIFESLESLSEIVLMGRDAGVGMLNVFNADKYYVPFWKMLTSLYDIEKIY